MTSVNSGARDRDSAGRPRQARPRDAMGRPLRYGDPGGVEPVPEEPLPAERNPHPGPVVAGHRPGVRRARSPGSGVEGGARRRARSLAGTCPDLRRDHPCAAGQPNGRRQAARPRRRPVAPLRRRSTARHRRAGCPRLVRRNAGDPAAADPPRLSSGRLDARHGYRRSAVVRGFGVRVGAKVLVRGLVVGVGSRDGIDTRIALDGLM
jgi:hypothetical protein